MTVPAAPNPPSRHRVLHHHWLSPPARAVRILLAEKGLAFDLALERVWERPVDFLRLNPAGEVPVLREADGQVLAHWLAILGHVESLQPQPQLLGTTPQEQAETWRLVGWFSEKFGREVTDNLVYEKVLRAVFREGAPHAESIRAGRANIGYHLEYIGWLTDRHNYLVGRSFGLADIWAAAQISCVDYIGDVPWNDHPGARDWYARVKSRPSMRGVLSDHVPGHPPAVQYADLDF